jgi:hypothetical protein
MLQDQEGLLDIDTPLAFQDGTKIYKKFTDEYITHKKGYFILGPSGIGKSHYVRAQQPGSKHWVDADQIWRKTKAMPIGAWWEQLDKIKGVEEQCDIITVQAKSLGLWLIGASCRWLKPDAVVLPHWKTHEKYIKMRNLNYDGGATELPKGHRKEIHQWTKQGVPEFKSVQEAIKFIENKYKKEFGE